MNRPEPFYFVIRLSPGSDQISGSTALFECDSLGHALKLCQKLNAEAGGNKFAVRNSLMKPQEAILKPNNPEHGGLLPAIQARNRK